MLSRLGFFRAMFFVIPSTFIAFLMKDLAADPLPWSFSPLHVGRVLYTGGWFQKYALGSIHCSPEFTFPLELVYLSTRTDAGLFGSRWFCPQLESSLVWDSPHGALWRSPTGSDIRLLQDDLGVNLFSDQSHTWIAKRSSGSTDISNADGWRYHYSGANLQFVASPTGRSLSFTWNKGVLDRIDLVDSASGLRLPVLKTQYVGTHLHCLWFNGTDHLFTFNGQTLLESWTAPNGRSLDFVYNDGESLSQIHSSDGSLQNFYTMCAVMDHSPTGAKNSGSLWLVQDPDNVYTYGKDTSGSLLAGEITCESNIGLSKKISYKPKEHYLSEAGYGRCLRTTYFDAPGAIYDSLIHRINDHDVIATETTYDPTTGVLTSVLGSDGKVLHFDYPLNWVRSSRYPWPPKPICIWYDSSATSPKRSWECQYNAAGQMMLSSDPDRRSYQYIYNKHGDLTEVVGPDGLSTLRVYDAFGRLIRVSESGGSHVVTYDRFGNLLSETLSGGSKIQFVYDYLGNISELIRNGVPIATYLRDSAGRLIAQRDALGHTQKFTYDCAGNLSGKADPCGAVTKYEYDPNGREIAQIDGNGNRVCFAYDLAGHLCKQVNALGNALYWTFNDDGNLTEEDNGVETTKRSYDKLKRLSAVAYGESEQQLSYVYDDQGQIACLQTPSNSLSYLYDSAGQLLSTHAICDGEENLIRFRYNQIGQRTGLLLARLASSCRLTGDRPNSRSDYEILQQTEYTYQNRQLTSVTSNGQDLINYQYDKAGRIILKTFGNGMRATFSYDRMGRLSEMDSVGGPLKKPIRLSYEWNDVDQITRRIWNGVSQHYEYDPCGRLVKVSGNDASRTILEAYTYDNVGNIAEKTVQGHKTRFTYNEANELAFSQEGAHVLPFYYDRAGRLLSATYTGGPTNSYGWSNKVVRTSVGYGLDTVFSYWPDGQLAAESESPEPDLFSTISYNSRNRIEHFLWDGLNLLRRNDIIFIAEPSPAGGAIFASHPIGCPDDITYYLNDILGSTLATVDARSVEFLNTSSFGQLISRIGTPSFDDQWSFRSNKSEPNIQ